MHSVVLSGEMKSRTTLIDDCRWKDESALSYPVSRPTNRVAQKVHCSNEENKKQIRTSSYYLMSAMDLIYHNSMVQLRDRHSKHKHTMFHTPIASAMWEWMV